MGTFADLAGCAGDDTDARQLLQLAYDAAADETPVKVQSMLNLCVKPGDVTDRMSLPVLCGLFVDYVKAWLHCPQEEVDQWETELLAGLFILRTGHRACAECLTRHGSITNLRPVKRGWIDCERCIDRRSRHLTAVA